MALLEAVQQAKQVKQVKEAREHTYELNILDSVVVRWYAGSVVSVELIQRKWYGRLPGRPCTLRTNLNLRTLRQAWEESAGLPSGYREDIEAAAAVKGWNWRG